MFEFQKAPLVLLTTLLILATNLPAQDRAASDRTSLRIGAVTAGDATIGGADWRSASGMSLGVSFDPRISGGLSLGLGLEIHRLSIGPTRGTTQTMPMLNPSLAARYYTPLGNDGWAVRPGVAVGLGWVREIEDLGGSQYLTFCPSFELLSPLSPETFLIFEVGMLSGWGGDGEQDAALEKLWLLRIGLLL